MFVKSLVQVDISFSVGFGFPLATSLGMVALILPGGIGLREVVLTGYLSLDGISSSDAATVAVASRLWFLIGEIFIFLLGLAADKYGLDSSKSKNGD